MDIIFNIKHKTLANIELTAVEIKSLILFSPLYHAKIFLFAIKYKARYIITPIAIVCK